MSYLSAMVAVLAAASGWYYAFYSTAALNLATVEQAAANRRRVRLRRFNGVLMMLLGVSLYLMTSALDKRWPPTAAAGLLLAVLLLLLCVGVLAIIDLRLTTQLRDELRRHRKDPEG